MPKKILKKTRVAVSLVSLIAITSYFLDYTSSIYTRFAQHLIDIQFIPSLLKFSSAPSFVACGFFAVILTTLLFGRIYCSTICPLGTLQDIIIFLVKKIRGKKFTQNDYQPPNNKLRYTVLALTALTAISGSNILLTLLDPYSIFARIINSFARLGYIAGNNQLITYLNGEESASFHQVNYVELNSTVLTVAVVSLIVIIATSALKGRLYCNTLCPVGTLLGIFSRLSLFKLVINDKDCSSCRQCEKKCKAQCIDMDLRKIDSDRCIMCLNCLPTCTLNSIGITRKKVKSGEISETSHPNTASKESTGKTAKNEPDKSKRQFLAGAGILATSAVLPSPKSSPKPRVASPPGSISHEHFNSKCTACHLCVAKCPTGVLQPASFEYGISGMMQPKMDFDAEFCQFSCTVCSEVCPTGAITKISSKQKEVTQIGIARFNDKRCVVLTDGEDCGACARHCPTQAVHMVPYSKDYRKIPKVEDHLCIGCGACEHKCPVEGEKAIIVEPIAVHGTAIRSINSQAAKF